MPRASRAPLTADEVKGRAALLGFAACGITTIDPLPHAEALDRWLASGWAGTMRYLHRQAAKRKHPLLADRTARRVIVVLDNYHRPERAADRDAPRIAAYARGRDYHLVTRMRLQRLARWLLRRGARTARVYVDTGPVAERELAQRAGLGWIGNNTMLIHPALGSWTVIGSVMTDVELAADAPFAADRCGTCRLCLDACPTGAFVEPRVLDATRCISYLTVESRGPLPPELADRMDGWAFGCDVCNSVCPWNGRFARPTTVGAFRARAPLTGAQWLRLDPLRFHRRFVNTAIERTGLERMRRNVRAALRSVGVAVE